MRILVTGGTGFIGRALIERLLARGDSVTGFTRRAAEAKRSSEQASHVTWVEWDPVRGGEWQSRVSGHDAIVHLSGEAAAGRRYTEALKKTIRDSRILSTELIVEGIERATERPRVIVAASGLGYYGNHEGDEPLSENSTPGSDFLAQVCVEWEAAARSAEAFGARAVSGRIGFVLGHGGGALARWVPIFKAFAGGPIASGRQMVSWVHLADTVGALVHAIDDQALRGPMNVAAPNAVPNAELARVLGRVLGRPALVPAPAFALRLLYGNGAETILSGQRAIPKVLLEHGYRFRFTELEPALRDLFP